MRLGVLGAGLGLLLIAVGAGARSLQTATPGGGGGATETTQVVAPLDGPGLFQERGCSQCHAIRGVGGHKGPELSGVGRRRKKEAIESQIVHGGGAMPAFGEALTAEETATLVKYLQHCRDRERSP